MKIDETWKHKNDESAIVKIAAINNFEIIGMSEIRRMAYQVVYGDFKDFVIVSYFHKDDYGKKFLHFEFYQRGIFIKEYKRKKVKK